MTFRATLILISGCAAALIVSSALAAQDTASTRVTAKRVTSETRVRVQKGESNGTLDVRADSIAASRARADSAERELATMRQRDSVEAVTRALADSVARIELMRRDSIASVAALIEMARRDSIARADSIIAAEQMRQQRMRDRYRFDGSGWCRTGDSEDLGRMLD